MAMAGSMAAPPGEEVSEVLEPVSAPNPQPSQPAGTAAQAEALSALSNLGYAPGDAAGAVAQAAGEMAEASTPDLIKAALKLLAPKG